ncbi:MAG: GspH/FimT family pseudopilin [Rhodoferax sp.]
MKPQHAPHAKAHGTSSLGRAAGMTLLELLTVLAVAAVLLTIAVPSFVSLTQTNRVAGEINALSGDLQFARAEAIKEGVPVSICASSNGTSCLGATTSTWNTGWIVFSDANGNQAVDTGDLVLRKQIPWKSTDTFTTTSSIGAVSYSRDGFAMGLPGAVTWTLHTSPLNSAATRCVYLNIAGHQQVVTNGQAVGTGTCS